MDHPQQMEKMILSGQSGVSRNRTFIQVDIGWWWVIPSIEYLSPLYNGPFFIYKPLSFGLTQAILNCRLTPLTASKIIAFGRCLYLEGGVRYELHFGCVRTGNGRRGDSSFLFPRPIERTGPEITRTRKLDATIYRVSADAPRPGSGLRW